MIYEVKIGKVKPRVNHGGDAASLRETLRRTAIACSTAYYEQSGNYASPFFVVGGFYFDFRWFFDADFQYIEPEVIHLAELDLVICREEHIHRIDGPKA